MSRLLAALLTAAALAWSVVILAAPGLLAREEPHLSIPATVAYLGAGRFCHQRAERTFHLAGLPMPVCARCSGLYLSGALGAIAAWGAGRRRGRSRDRNVLLACAVPTALTWGLEMAGLAPFSNLARAAAALPLGGASGWLFVRALRDEHAAPAPPAPPSGAR